MQLNCSYSIERHLYFNIGTHLRLGQNQTDIHLVHNYSFMISYYIVLS